jgi:ATP adenylyltransferase
MERLWTPWRMAYIDAGKETGENVGENGPPEERGGCIFCDLPKAGDDQGSLILGRGELAFAILNRFPYNPGHLMAAPYRHVGDYSELTPEELAELTALAGTGIAALKAESEPHGFNLGMNLGTVAGAGIADHVHLHLVPRWGGDTNFMPVVGQTKVLPELLEQTWEKLSPHFSNS